VAVLVFLWTASWLSACARCLDCPATPYGADVVVLTTPTMTVKDIRAVVAGPATETLVCQAVDGFLRCMWPPGVVVVPGTYSLQVSAAGYQTMTTQVEVTGEPLDMCGCLQDSITPSSVILSRADAGTD
jgi:PEGA domain